MEAQYYWTLKLNKYKDSTGNWKIVNMVEVSNPYLNIVGKVNPLTRYKEPDVVAGNEKNGGYYKTTAVLTGLINPFTNPVTNAEVRETMIEVAVEESNPWNLINDFKIFSQSLTMTCCEKIEKRYKELFGVEIKLGYTWVYIPSDSTSTSGSSGSSGSQGTSGDKTITEIPPKTSTAGTSGLSEPKTYGEFTFNVEEKFLFKGNVEFGTLETIGIGVVKEEFDEMEDEEYQEEYQEVEYMGEELLDFQAEALEMWVESAFAADPELAALADSEEDTYSTSTSVSITTGDSSDFWALVAICACEDADDQGRADVAQSIYNRVAAGKMFGGKTIKAIVTAKQQYEPAFNQSNRKEIHSSWKLISDKATAIAAVKYAKKYTDKQATDALKASFDAIYNKQNQKEAKDYVQQRTDFLGAGLGKSWFKGTGKWKSGKSSSVPKRRKAGSPNNIFGNVVGGGSYAYGKKNVIAEVPTELLEKFKF